MISWEKTKNGYRKESGNLTSRVWFETKDSTWCGAIYEGSNVYRIEPAKSKSAAMLSCDMFLMNPRTSYIPSDKEKREQREKWDWFSQGQGYWFRNNKDRSRFEVTNDNGEFYFTLQREDGSRTKLDMPYGSWQKAANAGENAYDLHRI